MKKDQLILTIREIRVGNIVLPKDTAGRVITVRGKKVKAEFFGYGVYLVNQEDIK